MRRDRELTKVKRSRVDGGGDGVEKRSGESWWDSRDM